MTSAIALLLVLASAVDAQAQQSSEPPPTFESLLKKISSARSNACDEAADFSNLETRIFGAADEAVTKKLNEPLGTPRTRALDALKNLEHLSAENNKGWPEEKRFQFEVVEIPPVLLVKMTIRNRATFSVFAIPERDSYNKPTTNWQSMGAIDDHRFQSSRGYESLRLFPLERGPSKRPRFLAEFNFAGCGSGMGVEYYAYEWNPDNIGDLNEFLKLEGAVSQEQPVKEGNPKQVPTDAFAPIGELRTHGPFITLPYCWFSAIDTWDNPSLCAVDTYDLSGDRTRFVKTVSNRLDMLPVARAIQYAQAHDYPAVLAYCGSSDVAQHMVREIPPYVSGVQNLTIQRIGASKVEIEIGEDPPLHFEVERRGDRWLVVSFRME